MEIVHEGPCARWAWRCRTSLPAKTGTTRRATPGDQRATSGLLEPILRASGMLGEIRRQLWISMIFGWNLRATLNSEDDPEDLGGNLEGRGEVPGELGGELIRDLGGNFEGFGRYSGCFGGNSEVARGNSETGRRRPGNRNPNSRVSVINGRMKQRAARRLPRRTNSPGQSVGYRWFVLSGAPASHTCRGPVFMCR
jgi:hypothetical protein